MSWIHTLFFVYLFDLLLLAFSKWSVLVPTAPSEPRDCCYGQPSALATYGSFGTPLSHLHWRDHAMIRQSLHSPPHWSPQFLDPDIFRTESPSSTVRHKSPSQQILKCKHVLESQGDVLEKSQGRHITKIQFKGWNLPLQFASTICRISTDRRGKKGDQDPEKKLGWDVQQLYTA